MKPRGALALALATLAVAGCDASPLARDEQVARVASRTLADGRADAVFGQPDLASGLPPASVSVATLSSPQGLAADLRDPYDAQQLWIAEAASNRARAVKAPSFEALELHGQPTYDDGAPNGGSVDPQQSGLAGPTAVAFDSVVREWAVADTTNHRVVRGYLGAGPRVVYGQHGAWNAAAPNDGGLGQWSLAEPKGVALANGFLWIADAGNHRVLGYWSGSTYAGAMFGQASYGLGLPNRGDPSPSAYTLSDPRGLAVRGSGNGIYGYTVWIADTGNHRVLEVPWGALIPSRVLGQLGFTIATPGAGASGLNQPTAVALDVQGGVWVADTGNCRVIHFRLGSAVADRVLGQPDFASHACPTAPGPSALAAPTGVAVTPDGDVYVADATFHRVLRFHAGCAEEPGCDDFDPCTDDRCVADHCEHVANPAAERCAPFACGVAQHACYTYCSSSAECAPGFTCRSTELGSGCVRACATDGDCASATGRHVCARGVCCDRACDAPCEACDQPGAEGTCTPVYGLPRHGACPGADLDCVGSCTGALDGSCTPAPEGTACGAEGCANGVGRARGTCDGAGTCRAEARACGPFACAPGGCRTACRDANDCAAGAYCEAGACLFGPLFSQGGGCQAGRADAGAPDAPVGGAPIALVLGAPVLAGLARRLRRGRSRARASARGEGT